MFSKLVKAQATKEQAEKELEDALFIIREFCRLMDLKAPISEEKAKQN